MHAFKIDRFHLCGSIYGRCTILVPCACTTHFDLIPLTQTSTSLQAASRKTRAFEEPQGNLGKPVLTSGEIENVILQPGHRPLSCSFCEHPGCCCWWWGWCEKHAKQVTTTKICKTDISPHLKPRSLSSALRKILDPWALFCGDFVH